MDQQTNEQIVGLKADLYDKNNTIKQLNQLIIGVCQSVGVDLSQGFSPDALFEKLEQLKGAPESE